MFILTIAQRMYELRTIEGVTNKTVKGCLHRMASKIAYPKTQKLFELNSGGYLFN